MSDEARRSDFKSKLDGHHKWPSLYMFKFIVPSGKEGEVEKLFPKNEVKVKSSNKGNYSSLTIQVMMPGSEEVVRIYEEANKIKGLIAL